MAVQRSRYVRVVGPGADEFFDAERYAGRIGRVVAYSATNDLAGVGDSARDPAFLVRFAPSFGRPAVEDLFWTEELAPLAQR